MGNRKKDEAFSCNKVNCDYFNVNMEQNCSYSIDNSKCVIDDVLRGNPIASHAVLGEVGELLPCPFCGSNVYEARKVNLRGRPSWEIQCKQFCISMIRGSKKEVIEDWNSRANLA